MVFKSHVCIYPLIPIPQFISSLRLAWSKCYYHCWSHRWRNIIGSGGRGLFQQGPKRQADTKFKQIQLKSLWSTCTCWANKKFHAMWNHDGLWPQRRFVLAWFSSAYYCFFVDYLPFFDESNFQHFHISWLDLPHVHSLVQHVPTMFYRVQVWQIC